MIIRDFARQLLLHFSSSLHSDREMRQPLQEVGLPNATSSSLDLSFKARVKLFGN
jgi:hypothetical protein